MAEFKGKKEEQRRKGKYILEELEGSTTQKKQQLINNRDLQKKRKGARDREAQFSARKNEQSTTHT